MSSDEKKLPAVLVPNNRFDLLRTETSDIRRIRKGEDVAHRVLRVYHECDGFVGVPAATITLGRVAMEAAYEVCETLLDLLGAALSRYDCLEANQA
jgi:hypothetical protein